MDGRSIQVLLIEDNPADIELARVVLEQGATKLELSAVTDGVEALAFLRQEGDFRDAQRPDLILLDLNLPKKDGREVLRELKADPALRRIPVLVLTSSEDESDIATSYDLGASCYIAKPVELNQFEALVCTIDAFWFRLARLPPR